jgi:FMN phosphatase YigB (HAD superfamily)
MLATCAIGGPDGQAADLAATLNGQWAAAQALAPAAGDVLRRLARSWPLGLITNGPSDAQRAVVEALGITATFRWLLVSGDSVIGSRKPAPAIFAHAAHLASCPSGALLYVGDSAVNDVAGAAAAGWRTCWLRHGDGELPGTVPPPDLELSRLEDLTAALLDLEWR